MNKKVAVGYCRVSTDEQADNGLSLDYQEAQCTKAAQSDGYTEIIIKRDEGKSGTSIHKRPGMREIITLAENMEISAVYVTHSDRLARNVTDHAVIRSLFREKNIALKYLNGQSSGHDAVSVVADNMFAAFNQYHSDNTREKTLQATEAKARAGYFPTHAPVGYINSVNPNKDCEKVAKKIIVPNPKTSHLVTEAFALMATGRYSGYELNDLMYGKGLTANSGKKLAPSIFYNMLRNRIYLGEIHWQNIHTKDGKHTSLIDEDTFNRVQGALSEKLNNRCRRRKYFWLLNGFIFCPTHKRRFTAEWHLKKEKAYYHCPNKNGCGKYVEKSDLENQVAEKFKNLEFAPEFVSSILDRVRTILQEKRTSFSSKQRSLLNKKNAWEAKQRTATDRLLDQTLSKEAYSQVNSEATTAIADLERRIAQLKKDEDIDVERASEVLGLTKDLYVTYIGAPEALQRMFIGFFFEGFDVESGIIIKERYHPLFEELMRINAIYYQNQTIEESLENNADSKVILKPELGDYWESNPD